ncbi:MAG: PspA/IM30 family protein [Peptostreptococcaceae bacterium]|nr:PspA/IM30 family protein [Peptostreptococcaceae bacterium]
MANILGRFKDIMSANVNALLDKVEDPAKMVDQYLRNMEKDLQEVKEETAAVMAEETRAKRELDACIADIDKMQEYAKRALESGNEGDARKFLETKTSLATKKESLEKIYETAAGNAQKMRGMYDKLVQDIQALQAKKSEIKAKVAVAKTQQNMSKIGTSVSSASGNMSAFSRMEEKANRMLDEAGAMSELNRSAEDSDISKLTEKYSVSTSAVDAELEALKAELNK